MKLRDIYLKIGNRLFQFDENLHIQQLNNGYVFRRKFYVSIDEMMPDLEKAVKLAFKEEK